MTACNHHDTTTCVQFDNSKHNGDSNDHDTHNDDKSNTHTTTDNSSSTSRNWSEMAVLGCFLRRLLL